jgi:hypothetical protein
MPVFFCALPETFDATARLNSVRRFLVLLLLCVFSFQLSLEASADALFHAGGGQHHDAMSPHAHEHEHDCEAPNGNPMLDDDAPRLHGECGECHGLHTVATLNERAEYNGRAGESSICLPGKIAAHRSAAAERPERPNWLALV